MACHIPLESSWRGLQFCFRPHFNWRFAQKVMGFQNRGNPNFGNLGTPTWESRDKMTFECWPHGQAQRILWGGRWWLPLNPGCGEFYESVFACGLSVHQKCSSYALINLLFGLYRSVWVIEMLINFSSPHSGALAHPSTFEVLRAKERVPTPSPSIIFTFGLAVESIKELRGVSILGWGRNLCAWGPQCQWPW